uniref:Uncharacterized protein n=1 Tax=Arundo donax TaxID=35708 RepID=A0A0A9C9R1_ARUDO
MFPRTAKICCKQGHGTKLVWSKHFSHKISLKCPYDSKISTTIETTQR